DILLITKKKGILFNYHKHARTNKKFIKRKHKELSLLWLSSRQNQISKRLETKQLESVVVIDKNLPVPDIIDHNLNGISISYSSLSVYFQERKVSQPDTTSHLLLTTSTIAYLKVDKISMEEIIHTIPSLKQKVKTYHPKFICFNGMAVYEAFMEYEFRNLKVSPINIKNKWKFGLQPNVISWDTKSPLSYSQNNANLLNQSASGHTKIFVSMSTSGRIMEDQRDEQIKYFKELKILLNSERGLQSESEIPNVTDQEMDFNLDIDNQGIKMNNFDSFKNVNYIKNNSVNKAEEEILKIIHSFQNEIEMNYCMDDHESLKNSFFSSQITMKYSEQSDNKEQSEFTPPKSFKAVKW
ncbi:2514_t:CDS:2, partial [Scutellospora calospora]